MKIFCFLQVICLAVTVFPLFNCRDTRNIIHPKSEQTAMIHFEKSITPQKNETTAIKKNNTLVDQENESVVRYDHLESNRKQPIPRQVPIEIPVTSGSNGINAEHTLYQSPLMVYPFPMMNTYNPRYFPYTYPGYQGYPFFG